MTAHAAIRKHFESYADHYERDAFDATPGLRHVSARELAIVRHRLPGVDGRQVVDLGVGTGRFARMLVAGGADVVGMDFSKEMLRVCARNEPRVRLVHGQLGTPLPFSDEMFDDVVCIRVIKYVNDWAGALGEMRRIIRPGGRLLIEVANRRSAARWGYVHMDVRLETIGHASSLLQRHGFTITAVDGGTRLPYPVYGWARTKARLRGVLIAERMASSIVGPAALARSVIFTCGADPVWRGSRPPVP